ncbi:unnamed protein product [Bursaphelenchus xylophilus]|uniref:(pine wood nematode) hypothetical protein n=1 Tax=Bursaphelenchus xylophilus TaxID=6326 RepID=A0A7I8XEQ3_BURXY|nr:unnamed protein product [Bursaphelenchus xylophilus]CAG9113832.1 unnamed protein product [Bursaphelenchus xylophilus]
MFKLYILTVLLAILMANVSAFSYYILIPADVANSPDYLQQQPDLETMTRARRSEMRNILGSVVFDPQFRRIARNTDDKRMNFQRTGGPILLG